MREGGGILKGKYGEWLNDRDTIYESVVYGVVSPHGERFGAPDFGTFFLDAVEVNEADAIGQMNIEAYRGASKEDVQVNDIMTVPVKQPDNTIVLETTIIASARQTQAQVVFTLG